MKVQGPKISVSKLRRGFFSWYKDLSLQPSGRGVGSIILSLPPEEQAFTELYQHIKKVKDGTDTTGSKPPDGKSKSGKQRVQGGPAGDNPVSRRTRSRGKQA